MKPSPLQIRIRCAEIEGWTGIAGNAKCMLGYAPNSKSDLLRIPKYDTSIDTIIAAVLRLSGDLQRDWIDEMFRRAPLAQGRRLDKFWYATCPAIMRARAFVAIHEGGQA